MEHQKAKIDEGKPRLSLVPTAIIPAIASVREFGNKKYKDPDSWQTVDPKRYIDALLRHTVKLVDEPLGKDKESGLPHLWHMACNVAFLCSAYKSGKLKKSLGTTAKKKHIRIENEKCRKERNAR
ncbi:MAG: hypothetical protein GX896_05845 [Clostridiales bacterium]|nr:hypothetical protein [Clostridiales bacterium]